MTHRTLILVVLLGLSAARGRAIEIDSVLLPRAKVVAPAARALRVTEAAGMAPLAVLRPARVGALDQLDAITAWNTARRVPARNGFSRPLPVTRRVDLAKGLRAGGPFAGGVLLAPPDGTLVWGTEVRVSEGQRLRLHLAQVDLPADAELWVYGEGDEEVAFGVGSGIAGGELWTPSIGGPAIRLEVKLPAGWHGAAAFTVDRVLESFDLDPAGAPRLSSSPATKADTGCLRSSACVDATVLPNVEVFRRAVARLAFVQDGMGYLCSGGLLNDSARSGTPYLLTAHHCISTQQVASTVEAFFDDFPAACGGPTPDPASLPRVQGATLLTTGSDADYTLLQLSSLPPGRGLLGSTDEPVAPGTQLAHLSHPFGYDQQYSSSTMTATAAACDGAPRPSFVYSVLGVGGPFPGSSGAPVVRVSDGKVVGELLGSCGPTASAGAGCDSSDLTVDGALAASFHALASFLAPAANATTCTPDATTLCLGDGNRFRVEASYDDGTRTAAAQLVRLTANAGYLWFFDASNVEALVKVIDGCALNQRYWVYAAGLTDLGVTIRITDTQAQSIRTYSGVAGAPFPAVRDINAFATCP